MKKIICLLLVSTGFFLNALSAYAAFVPYDGYEYDVNNEPVLSTNVYAPKEYIMGDIDSVVTFDKPCDMFIDKENRLFYIVSGGRKSIIVMGLDGKLKKEITSLKTPSGEETALLEPAAVFVKSGQMYICDTEAFKVYITDTDGNIKREIIKPESSLYPQNTEFRPIKVIADNLGFTYVLIRSLNYGALAYDENGEFSEFYGSNRVETTADFFAKTFWRFLMTEEQIANSSRFVPNEYNSFDIDREGFIYTCTGIAPNNTEQIKKLNPVGENIFPSQIYGEYQIAYYKNQSIQSRLCDITVNDEGFIYGLDSQRGRIYMYDYEGNPVAVFGGKSNQTGTFTDPVSIDTFQKSVYVLDRQKSSVTRFELTEYGHSLYTGTVLNIDGKYDEAKELWLDVIRQNANCRIAYYGVGKAEYYNGNYNAAMKYFKLGDARISESMAFEALRIQVMRKITPYLITILVLGVISVKILKHIKKRKALKRA